MSKFIYYVLFSFALISVTTSCDDDDTIAPEVISKTVSELGADAGNGQYDQMGQPLGTTNHFTLFNFTTGLVVPIADSATTKWDIGFRGTTIIVNGGISGPGKAAAQVWTGIFADLAEAPETGYSTDAVSAYAIPSGSGKGWYTYNPAAMTIIPTAGKVLIFKTADEKYAKMEILSYYKGAPAAPKLTDLPRFFTFRYSLQVDGTRKF